MRLHGKIKGNDSCRGAACNNSGGTHQFKDNRSNETAQLATSITYKGLDDFTFQYGNSSSQKVTGKVGRGMSATLDPSDPKTGTDTSGSDAFNALFKKLQKHTSTSWVRGHLLNHDLGGIAMYNNLFPITTAANGEHYHEVEKLVKHWVANGCDVQYDVDARGPKAIDNPTGAFNCEAEVTNDPTFGQKFAGKKIQKSIVSSAVKTTATRVYGKKKNQNLKKKNSWVVHGKDNNTLRDDYSAHTKKNVKWNHLSGSSKRNNFKQKGVTMGYIDTNPWSTGISTDYELSHSSEYDHDAMNEYMGG